MIVRPSALPITSAPLFQALFAPAKIIYGIFLEAIGSLLLCLGALEWGGSLKERGERLDSGAYSLFVGLFAYGGRLLVATDNYDQTCRGSCYWFIHEHFSNPDLSPEEIALIFENGPPEPVVELHRQNLLPDSIDEEKIWSVETAGDWPLMPDLDPGIYTFMLGFSKDAAHPGKAHRFVFLQLEGRAFLFDVNTGLSAWEQADWAPLLNRIGGSIRSEREGIFTLECYHYSEREPLQMQTI